MAALHAWFLRDGDAARPSYVAGASGATPHMPELAPTWEAMTELAGGGDLAARVLALYDPPPLLAGCSQAVIGGTLIRNYDYHPDRIEATILATALTRPMLGMSDCLWGLLDGVNDAGLAAALAFGGRQARGRGSGSRSIVRYLLETCDTVEQAIKTLQRLPVHAPYNLTLADPTDAATVFIGPDRPARDPARRATNHQETVDWPEHAAADAQRRAPRRPVRRDRRRRVPRPAAVRDRVRARLRHALHGGVQPASRAVSYHWPDDAGSSRSPPLRPQRGPSDSGSVQTATSALVLGDLLAQEDLGLTLLSGGAGALDREIAGAHSIDVEAPTRFLERRWVMLTAGHAAQGQRRRPERADRRARRGRDQRARDRHRARVQERPAGAAGGGARALASRSSPCRWARRSGTSSASSTARCSPATCTPTSG